MLYVCVLGYGAPVTHSIKEKRHPTYMALCCSKVVKIH